MKNFTLCPLAASIVLCAAPLTFASDDRVALNNEAPAFITVENSAAPVITDSKLGAAIENEPWEKQLKAKDKDAGSQALYFRAVKAPAGFTMSATGKAQWTPDFSQAGQHNVVIAVSDGLHSSEKTLVLTVKNTNRAPVWQQAPLMSATENVAYKVKLQANDRDNQALSFSLKSAPKGMKIEGDNLLWLPSFEQAGEHSFEMIVSDGIEKVAQTFSLQLVNANRAPVFTSKSHFQLSENALFTVQLKAKDADKPEKLSFKKLTGPEGLTVSLEGELSFMPSFDDAGEHSVLVEVSDGELKAVQRLSLVVSDTNRAPQWVSTQLAAATELAAYSAQLVARDEDKADTLTYRLKSGPEGLLVSTTGVITFKPSYDQAGEQKLEVLVSDNKQDVKQVFQLNVENTNRAPEFVSKSVILAPENETYKYKLKAIDADNDALTFKLISGPKGLKLEGGTLTMLPSFEQAGEYPVHLKVSDNSAEGILSDEQFFTLKVKNANRAASISSVEDTQLGATENSLWTLPITASDLDGDALSYSLVVYPKGMSIQGNTISWTPSFEGKGRHDITLVVNDGTQDTPYAFSLNVANTNRLPSFTSTPVLSAKESETYQYILRATDADREPLNFKLLSGPEGLMLDPVNPHILTWQPGFQQSGEHHITVAVFDEQASVEQNFTVKVANTNRAPEFPKPVTEVLEDNAYMYKAYAQDPDLEDKKTVIVTALTLPDGMVFKDNTLSWKPDFKSADSYSIVLSASDGDLTTEQSFTLTVKNNNRAPVISSVPKTVAHETLSYQYTIQATDADDEAMTYQLVSGPEGMTLTGATINWTPQYTQGGDQSVVIGVNDGIDTTQQVFSVKVKNANRAPSLDKIPSQAVVVGSKFKYQLSSADVDGDSINFKLVHGPEGLTLSKKGLIKYKPKSLLAEPVMIIIQVDDGELKQRRRFELTVVSKPEKE